MTSPDEKPRKNPAERFRKILSAEKDQGPAPETRKPAVVNLPRVKADLSEPSSESLRSPKVSQTGSAWQNGRTLPIFWTVAGILSLAANALLFVMVANLMHGMGAAPAAGFGPGLLGGLYANFEQMDQAHINATIPIEATIKLSTTIPIQATTDITLARDVAIQGAQVKINTGGLNIDAPASITLPAGTLLKAALDFNVPVQADVPIALDVPLDIAIQDTGLHAALVGMQQTIRPALCAASPGALSLTGQAICR